VVFQRLAHLGRESALDVFTEEIEALFTMLDGARHGVPVNGIGSSVTDPSRKMHRPEGGFGDFLPSVT
jgi:hypothetical protein